MLLRAAAYIFMEQWQRRITRKRSLPWCRRLEMSPTPRVIGRGLDVCI